MTSNCHFTIIFIGLCLCRLSTQSAPHYSLQTAINYLNEPLRESYQESAALVNPYLDNERGGYEGYYDDDAFNDDYEDSRKRSMFRKRGTVFRERTRQQPTYPHHEQEVLAEKFLRAIEEEREREQEQEYKHELKNLWSRYQNDENDIERELFANEFDDDNSVPIEEMKRKRQRGGGEIEVAPNYWSQKRSMPLLPWLPAKKKRFPVAKRSPKESDAAVKDTLKPTTTQKVADVEIAAKKKRSDDVKATAATSMPAMSLIHGHVHQKRDTMAVAKQPKVPKNGIVKRQADEDSSEDEGEDHEVEEDEHHEHEERRPDYHDSEEEEDDEDAKRKKKRETQKVAANKPISIAKRSSTPATSSPFEWSDLFGLDRKKKSVQAPKGEREQKLEAMERKLKTMEEYVLQDTAKYAEIPQDNLTPSEERALKGRISQRLATVYSLEKLRKAVQRLRESIALGNNFIEGIYDDDEEKKKAKRVAVKKEKAEFDNADHEVDQSHNKVTHEIESNDHNANKDDKKRKKKRNELSNFISEHEPMSEEMMGGGGVYDSSSCPILDSIERKCRGVDMMNGDFHQNLLDTCGAHQLCYLCGDSPVQCDYDYMAEAEEICDTDMKCNIIARQTLSALKSAGAVKISPRECMRNPCIRMAVQTLSTY